MSYYNFKRPFYRNSNSSQSYRPNGVATESQSLVDNSSRNSWSSHISISEINTKLLIGECGKIYVGADIPFSHYGKQTKSSCATASTYLLEQEFETLMELWKQDTFALSSLTKIYAHPAYQRIMAMGKEGIPFLLRQVQKGEGRWFYALKFMAGENISAGMSNFEDAKSAWLEWGYYNNYI